MNIQTERQPRKLPLDGLPNRLRRYRIERGYTLSRLAQEVGVSPQAIKEAETKGTGLSRQKWYRLADLFDCDPRILETPDNFSPQYQVST